MALNADQKKVVEMLKDPKLRKELLSEAGDNSADLEDILQEIDVTDDDDIQSVSKKHQAQIKKLVNYFTKEVTNAENRAVDKSTKDSRKAEDAKIQKFSADNPGMKDPKVVALMQPLYDNGETLAESYAAACRGLKLDPATGKAPEEDKGDDKDKDKDKSKDTKVKRSSAKSGQNHDDDGDSDDGDDGKKAEPKSLSDALAANSAAYIAKHGNPFESKD